MIWLMLGWFVTGLWSAGLFYAELRSIGARYPNWNAVWRRGDTACALAAALAGPLVGIFTIADGQYKGWRLPGSEP